MSVSVVPKTFLPSEVTTDPKSRFQAVSYKGGVFLIGKVVSVRYYNVTNPRSDMNKRTQIVLSDGSDTLNCMIQILFTNMRPNGNEILKNVVKVGPVDIREKNAGFDSCPGHYTAHAKSYGLCTEFSVLNDIEIVKHVPEEDSRNRLKNVQFVPYVHTIGRVRSMNLTRISPVSAFPNSSSPSPSVQQGACVNVAGVLREGVHENSGKRGELVFVMNDDTAAAEVMIAKSSDPQDPYDVYNMYAKALSSAAPGEFIILLDFLATVAFDEGRLKILLKSWGPSRISVGVRSDALKQRLTQPPPPPPADVPFLTRAEARFSLPSVELLVKNREAVNGKTINVIGTVDKVSSSQYSSDFTRLKCSKDFKHHDFFTENASSSTDNAPLFDDNISSSSSAVATIKCRSCGPFSDAKVERFYDASTSFKEGRECEDGDVSLKWSNNAAAAYLFRMSAADFDRENAEKKEAIVKSIIGKSMALRVWCKTDGSKIVLEACVFDGQGDDQEVEQEEQDHEREHEGVSAAADGGNKEENDSNKRRKMCDMLLDI